MPGHYVYLLRNKLYWIKMYFGALKKFLQIIIYKPSVLIVCTVPSHIHKQIKASLNFILSDLAFCVDIQLLPVGTICSFLLTYIFAKALSFVGAIFLVIMWMDERCHAEMGDTVRLAAVLDGE